MNSRYPYYSQLNERVIELPDNLPIKYYEKIRKFLTKYNGIIKIKYLELVNIAHLLESDFVPGSKSNFEPGSKSKSKSKSNFEPGSKSKSKSKSKSNFEPGSKSKSSSIFKFLRTSRKIPYFTNLQYVIDLPIDLSYLKFKKLAKYLINHQEITLIHYNKLYELVYLKPITSPIILPDNIDNIEDILIPYGSMPPLANMAQNAMRLLQL